MGKFCVKLADVFQLSWCWLSKWKRTAQPKFDGCMVFQDLILFFIFVLVIFMSIFAWFIFFSIFLFFSSLHSISRHNIRWSGYMVVQFPCLKCKAVAKNHKAVQHDICDYMDFSWHIGCRAIQKSVENDQIIHHHI